MKSPAWTRGQNTHRHDIWKSHTTDPVWVSGPGGSGCKYASYRTHTGSSASPGRIERVSKIVMCIGTKLCYCLQKLHLNWSLDQRCRRFDPRQGRSLMTGYTGGLAVWSPAGGFRVALQPILNGGDLCFVNCDANIVSYYYGRAVWLLVLSC